MKNTINITMPYYYLAFLVTSFIFIIIIYGMISNYIVIQNNNGDMPTYTKGNIPSYISDDKHFYYNDSSKINNSKLADNYYMFDRIYSIGDIIMFSGSTLLLLFIFVLNYKLFTNNKPIELNQNLFVR